MSINRNCLYCGEPFTVGPRERSRRHCSGWCRDTYYRRKGKPRDPSAAPARPPIVAHMATVTFHVCSDCGVEQCSHRESGLAPSLAQIAEARAFIKAANIAAGVIR